MIENPHLAVITYGTCKRCGWPKVRLRFGACMSCANRVAVSPVAGLGYWVWDIENPENRWFVGEAGTTLQ